MTPPARTRGPRCCGTWRWYGAAEHRTVARQLIVQEFDFDGSPMESPRTVGRSVLVRTADGVSAVAAIRGLEPGGVYTFWWAVVQEDGTFPDDIFVASGAGAMADEQGKARVTMSADVGEESIRGFMPDGVNEIVFDELFQPLDALVRIEIAFHGQADQAGDELETWLYDFWTGNACRPETPNPNPAQPHCPVYYAATFG